MLTLGRRRGGGGGIAVWQYILEKRIFTPYSTAPPLPPSHLLALYIERWLITFSRYTMWDRVTVDSIMIRGNPLLNWQLPVILCVGCHMAVCHLEKILLNISDQKISPIYLGFIHT